MSTVVFSFGLSAFLSLLLAIGLLTSRALNPRCARLLGVNYLLFALQGALGVAVFTDFWPQAALARAQLAMLLGPALYGYFISVLSPDRLRTRHWYWHLLPVAFMALVLWQHWWALVDWLIIVSFTAYWLIVLWRVLKADSQRQTDPPARAWLWILVALMPINIGVEVAVAIEIRLGAHPAQTLSLQIGGVIFAVFHTTTLILALTRSPLIEWMHELKLPGTSELGQAEKRSLFQRWQSLVEDRSLYCTESAMTVSRAARLLGVPARHLSQSINSIYQGSFSQYLNDVRVEKAKALLQAKPQMSITDVYSQVGFSSKSHFHREFSRVVGTTPSSFRKKVASS